MNQLVLADKYEGYKVTYAGCHVFNPGRFVGKSLVFSTYTPAEVNSEEWYDLTLFLIQFDVEHSP